MTPAVRVMLLAVVLLCDGGEWVHAQGRPTRSMGLIFATKEQLRGVPLANTPYSGAELPSSVDLSKDMPPTQNQGPQNSCVAWSVAYALKSYQERIQGGRPIVLPDGRIDAQRVFSPAFVYNQLNQGRDGGVSFLDALNLVRDQGAAPWADMPYDPSDFRSGPSPQALVDARRFRIDTWRQVNVQDTREIKAHLQAGYPVLFGATVDDGFHAAGPGYLWDARRGNETGGHGMVLVGYDDARRAFKLMNSWGRNWGDGGYGWVSYEHFRRVTNEAYVAKAARHGPPPQPTRPPDVEVTPPPTPAPVTRDIDFAITSVQYNAVFPGNPVAGYFLRFDGTLSIPPGVGRTDQIVIHFYFDGGGASKGMPVGSLTPVYATVQGQAASGTAVYPVPPEGILGVRWSTWIPYSAFNVRMGAWVQTYQGPAYQPAVTSLVAEPVMFVDNFGVKSGGLFPFYIQR